MKNAGKLKIATKLIIILFFYPVAQAEPPGRVARLADLSGIVSFSPAGETEWVVATRNRPLVMGDRLWTDKGARTILQLGESSICLKDNTNLNILNLTPYLTQFQLPQGTLKLQINRLAKNRAYEINTPNLALVIKRPGDYRIEVGQETTAITVINGRAEALGKTETFLIDSKKTLRFSGDDLQYKILHYRAADVFDRWCTTHLASSKEGKAALYVSSSVIGYEDLDHYGTWHSLEKYGPAWTPSHVRVNWTPYRQGTWSWIEPWGWTWVGAEPWGFAPYHYGRWTHLNDRWYWVPGPQKEEAIYAPALVAFISDALASKQPPQTIAWFPLAPGEIYWPAYRISRAYFYQLNQSNTRVPTSEVMPAYENPQPIRYENLQVAESIVSVPTDRFIQAALAGEAATSRSSHWLENTRVWQTATVVPDYRSVLGSVPTLARPADEIIARMTLLKTPLPASRVSFAQKQEKLKEYPGKPLDPQVAVAVPRKQQKSHSQMNVSVIHSANLAEDPLRVFEAYQQAAESEWTIPAIVSTAGLSVEERDFYPQASEP